MFFGTLFAYKEVATKSISNDEESTMKKMKTDRINTQTIIKGVTMKSITLRKLASLILMTFLIFTIGCSENDPLSPDLSDQSISQQDNGIKILTLNDDLSLGKVTKERKHIKAKRGGKIELEHRGSRRERNRRLAIWCKLEIPANAMDKDSDISLTIDDHQFSGAMDVEFAPHGTIFSTPALLTIYARGLDLKDIDPETVGFYYDNQETGEWEKMEYDKLRINVRRGTIYVKNAQLPHFSRYAIATE